MNYPLFKVHIKKEEALLKIEKVFDIDECILFKIYRFD